jgi:hypothetical protein
MAQHLIPKVGFGWAIRICAFLILGMLLLSNLTITSNLKHSPKPFSIMDYLKPIREFNFCILAISSFFLYCKCYYPGSLWSTPKIDSC